MSQTELVLHNATIVTSGAPGGGVGAVAVRDGRIAAVGDNAEVSALAGATTRLIDCGGRALLPGFIDAHVHLLAYAETFSGVDVSPARAPSIEAIKSAVRTRAEATPPGEWVRAHGYHEFFLEDAAHPTRWDLDAVSPRNPVRLIHQNRHLCVLNSLALQAAGITRHTPNPPDGIVEKDPATGEPTGLLLGMNLWLARNVVPPLGLEELRQGVRMACRSFLAQGVTCVHDASPRNGSDEWRLYKALAESGDLSVRVRMMIGVDRLEEALRAGLRPREGHGQRLKLGAAKIVVEQIGARLYSPPDVLASQVRSAHEAGFQVAIHAITPQAVRLAIEAIMKLGGGEAERRRHRLEHCTYLPYAMIRELRQVGVTVVGQPSFIHYNGARYLGEVPANKFGWICRGRSLLREGVPLVGSTDTPVVPNSILTAIGAAVTRESQIGFVFGHRERMSVGEAVAMFTTQAARAGFDDRDMSEIAPGRLADLVLLEEHPAKVAPDRIKDIRPSLTLLGGRQAHRV